MNPQSNARLLTGVEGVELEIDKVDVDKLNAVKSVLADVSSVSPSSEQ